MSVGRPETDPHFMWSLEFGDFAQDFVGHNLDDNWILCHCASWKVMNSSADARGDASMPVTTFWRGPSH
jgi:hypothetical protein